MQMWSELRMKIVWTTVVIMQNMIIENEDSKLDLNLDNLLDLISAQVD